MLNLLTTLIAFIVAIAILVIVHEWGHFIVARCFGIKVARFSVGFGKSLWTHRTKTGMEFCIGMLPLGGYVKMQESADHDKNLKKSEQADLYENKSVWIRMAVVVAGPLCNFIFAVFALIPVYHAGMQGLAPIVDNVEISSPAAFAGLQPHDEIIAVDGQPTVIQRAANDAIASHETDKNLVLKIKREGQEKTLTLKSSTWGQDRNLHGAASLGFSLSIPAWVGEIEPGTPAAAAKLERGDKIVGFNNNIIHDWLDLVTSIAQHPDETVTLTVIHQGDLRMVPVRLSHQEIEGTKVGLLGIKLPDNIMRTQNYTVPAAIVAATQDTLQYIGLTFQAMGQLVLGKLDLDSLSGPIRIAEGAGQAAEVGLISYLQFLALISISLGAINLLPIPLLDGGHLLYYVLEAIRGRPISKKAQEAGMRIGLICLVLLMIFAMYNDVARLFS